METIPHRSGLVEAILCENCKASNPGDRRFCSQCSYPIAGTDQEKLNFRIGIGQRKQLLNEAQKKITSARMIIYILSGLFFIAAMVNLGRYVYDVMVVNLVICMVYLIFAAWTKSNPFGAILTAFIVYATVQVVNAFADPATIASGILFKIIFVVAFIKGIKSASEARTLMRELAKLKIRQVGSD